MKLYRTRTQAEYNWLMWKLEKKGKVSFIPLYDQGDDIVVYEHEEEDCLSYSDFEYAEEEYPNKPIINVSDLMKTDTLEQVVAEKNGVETYTLTDEERQELRAKHEYNPKAQRHSEITNELKEIYQSKNADYGDAFGETFQKLGIVSAVTRISDKTNRLMSLTQNDRQVEDETLEDTLMDLANYAIMTLIEMESEE